jgi:ribosomal protein L35AE/L33A
MSAISNRRDEYRSTKKHLDIIAFKLKGQFEAAFPVRSEVLFRRTYKGKVYSGVIVETNSHYRRVKVTNYATGKTYWIDSTLLEDAKGRTYDNH